MKSTLNLVIGLLMTANVVYKLFTCIHCDDSIFGMEVSGLSYILIHAVIAIILFWGAYRERMKVLRGNMNSTT